MHFRSAVVGYVRQSVSPSPQNQHFGWAGGWSKGQLGRNAFMMREILSILYISSFCVRFTDQICGEIKCSDDKMKEKCNFFFWFGQWFVLVWNKILLKIAIFALLLSIGFINCLKIGNFIYVEFVLDNTWWCLLLGKLTAVEVQPRSVPRQGMLWHLAPAWPRSVRHSLSPWFTFFRSKIWWPFYWWLLSCYLSRPVWRIVDEPLRSLLRSCYRLAASSCRVVGCLGKWWGGGLFSKFLSAFVGNLGTFKF